VKWWRLNPDGDRAARETASACRQETTKLLSVNLLMDVRKGSEKGHCGALVVSVPRKLATKPSIQVRSSAWRLFPCGGVADSKHSESRGGFSSAVKMPEGLGL